MTQNSPQTTNFNEKAFKIRQGFVVTEIQKIILQATTKIDVLDAGCGNGALLHSISKIEELNLFGFDHDKMQIEAAARATGGKASLKIATSEKWPYNDEDFDFISMLEVIEHLYDPDSAMKECRRVLKNKGTAVITTPYYGYLKNIALSATNKWRKHHMPLKKGGHIKLFEKQDLYEIAERNKFSVRAYKRLGRLPALAMMHAIVLVKD